MSHRRPAVAILFALLSASTIAAGDEAVTDPEIEHLLTTIGSSDCTFIRNGKSYPAAKAEDHLRMKYRRGKRHASTAELFIERLASKSSMSKKLYRIRCGSADAVPTGDWLTAQLAALREGADLQTGVSTD